MRLIPRSLAALFLLATAVAGGPGLAGLEAYQHAHRSVPGHGHRIHFEPRGGQDHDDACGAWLVSAPARTPLPPTAFVRVPDTFVLGPVVAVASRTSTDPTLLPLSRAPPLPV